MEKYIIILLLVSLFGVFGTSWNSDHYEVVEKNECVNLLDVFFDRAVIFRMRSDKILRSWMRNQELKCSTNFQSRTLKMGIIGVIQKMNFKEDCHNYIQLQNSKICSEILFGFRNYSTTTNQHHRYISEYRGPFSVENTEYRYGNYGREVLLLGVFVGTSSSLPMATFINGRYLQNDEDVDVILAFTGYRDCDPENVPDGWFNCGFGMCILDRYVGDGVVNCPFGDCRDEGSCEMGEANSPFINVSRSDDGDADISGLQAPKDTSLAERSEVVKSKKKIYSMQRRAPEEEIKTLEEVKNIREEFMKHNEILYNISNLMNSAVKNYQDGKFLEN